MPRPKSYTPEQKLKVLTLRHSGTPVTTIMVITGLSHGTIQRIIENAKKVE
jgi:predicted Holliday junction resolvase-like endonuclease